MQGASGLSITVTRLEKESTSEKLDKISEFLEQCKKSKEHEHQLPLTLLLDLAEDNNPRVRWRAIEALGVLKNEEKSLNALITALKDPNSIVRWNAALALGEIGDARATLPLLATLQDESKDVREMSNWAIIELGEKAVPFLIEALTYEDWWVRQEAARLLGHLGDERARDPLLRALKDPIERVRENVAEALGKVGGTQTVEGLILALQDEYGETRQNAIESLIKKGPEAVEPLIPMLNHQNKAIREAVCQILGEIGDPRAIDPLTQIKRYDPEFKMRRSAAKALRQIQQH